MALSAARSTDKRQAWEFARLMVAGKAERSTISGCLGGTGGGPEASDGAGDGVVAGAGVVLTYGTYRGGMWRPAATGVEMRELDVFKVDGDV